MAQEQENGTVLGLPWQVEELRVTAFPTPAAEVVTAADWERIVNQPPERVINKPRAGTLRCDGPFANGALSLVVQPDRTHWRYIAAVSPDVETRVPVIGTFSDCINEFASPIRGWIESRPNIKRVAFGAKLNHPVDQREEGYKLLDDLLPAVQVDPESSDFQYRVNRHRSAELDGSNYLINRLSNWSVIGWHVLIITPAQGSMPSSAGPVSHACSLELDMSTDAERSEELPRTVLPLLLDELISQATELVERGDIK